MASITYQIAIILVGVVDSAGLNLASGRSARRRMTGIRSLRTSASALCRRLRREPRPAHLSEPENGAAGATPEAPPLRRRLGPQPRALPCAEWKTVPHQYGPASRGAAGDIPPTQLRRPRSSAPPLPNWDQCRARAAEATRTGSQG